MLIRSQNKKGLINFNDLEIYIDRENTVKAYGVQNASDYTTVLGTYSTEEKAIKVLDMVQDKYTEYAKVADGFGNNIQGLYVLPRVFQMPQDSEV